MHSCCNGKSRKTNLASERNLTWQSSHTSCSPRALFVVYVTEPEDTLKISPKEIFLKP